jgi:ribosomal protein L15
MNLNNLTPAKGSVNREKRIARGQGSGHGGTSTRGHKGAKSPLDTLRRSDSKEVRCLYSVVYLSSDLRT